MPGRRIRPGGAWQAANGARGRDGLSRPQGAARGACGGKYLGADDGVAEPAVLKPARLYFQLGRSLGLKVTPVNMLAVKSLLPDKGFMRALQLPLPAQRPLQLQLPLPLPAQRPLPLPVPLK